MMGPRRAAQQAKAANKMPRNRMGGGGGRGGAGAAAGRGKGARGADPEEHNRKASYLEELTRQADEHTRILERERAALLAMQIKKDMPSPAEGGPVTRTGAAHAQGAYDHANIPGLTGHYAPQPGKPGGGGGGAPARAPPGQPPPPPYPEATPERAPIYGNASGAPHPHHPHHPHHPGGGLSPNPGWEAYPSSPLRVRGGVPAAPPPRGEPWRDDPDSPPRPAPVGHAPGQAYYHPHPAHPAHPPPRGPDPGYPPPDAARGPYAPPPSHRQEDTLEGSFAIPQGQPMREQVIPREGGHWRGGPAAPGPGPAARRPEEEGITWGNVGPNKAAPREGGFAHRSVAHMYDNDTEEVFREKENKKLVYARELEAQMREKKSRDAASKAARWGPVEELSPFGGGAGRGGGGAPLRDAHGHAVTDLSRAPPGGYAESPQGQPHQEMATPGYSHPGNHGGGGGIGGGAASLIYQTPQPAHPPAGPPGNHGGGGGIGGGAASLIYQTPQPAHPPAGPPGNHGGGGGIGGGAANLIYQTPQPAHPPAGPFSPPGAHSSPGKQGHHHGSAMLELRGGPSEDQRAQAEIHRQQLRDDLDQQIREKSAAKERLKQKEREDEVREERAIARAIAQERGELPPPPPPNVAPPPPPPPPPGSDARGLSRAEAASRLRVTLPDGHPPAGGGGEEGRPMAIPMGVPGLEGHYGREAAGPPQRVVNSPPRAAPRAPSAALASGPLSDTQTKAVISEIRSEQDRLRGQVAEQENALAAVREEARRAHYERVQAEESRQAAEESARRLRAELGNLRMAAQGGGAGPRPGTGGSAGAPSVFSVDSYLVPVNLNHIPSDIGDLEGYEDDDMGDEPSPAKRSGGHWRGGEGGGGGAGGGRTRGGGRGRPGRTGVRGSHIIMGGGVEGGAPRRAGAGAREESARGGLRKGEGAGGGAKARKAAGPMKHWS